MTTATVHKYDTEEPGAWKEFIDDMRSGEPVEIDAEMFDYWLGVLPPVFMGRHVHWPDPDNEYRVISVYASFGFAEWTEPITAFWREGDRFFCRRTNEMNSNH